MICRTRTDHRRWRPSGRAPSGTSAAREMGSAIALWLLISALSACLRSTEPPPSNSVKVAAAADLAFAFNEIGKAFEEATGVETTFSFGSTGLLARQIAEGAPFDLFAAANVSFVEDVIRTGACAEDSKALYGRGRIALWWRRGSLHEPLKTPEDLASPHIVKIAIANPDHAPYGRAAREALVKRGVWESVKGKVVYGENVQQTLQFAQSGNAEAAIVALSLALVAADGEYVLVEEKSHTPIDQALVVCGRGPATVPARALARFIDSNEGRAIMRRYGFLLSGESLAAAP